MRTEEDQEKGRLRASQRGVPKQGGKASGGIF